MSKIVPQAGAIKEQYVALKPITRGTTLGGAE